MAHAQRDGDNRPKEKAPFPGPFHRLFGGQLASDDFRATYAVV